MGAAVRSDAPVAGVALEALLAAIRPEVFPAVISLEASPVEVSQVGMVEVAEADKKGTHPFFIRPRYLDLNQFQNFPTIPVTAALLFGKKGMCPHFSP